MLKKQKHRNITIAKIFFCNWSGYVILLGKASKTEFSFKKYKSLPNLSTLRLT